MAERPAKIGKESILDAWDAACEDCPCFSIWFNSRDKAKQYSGNDVEETRTVLEHWLQANYVINDVSLYYLRIHPAPEKAYKWNSPIIESIPFRFNPMPDSAIGMYNGGANFQLIQAIQALKEPLDKINTRFVELEARLDEIENGTKEDDVWGKISGIMSNPNVAPVIANAIGKVVDRIMSIPGIVGSAPAINGITQNTQIMENEKNTAVITDEDYLKRINDALLVLQDHCDLGTDLPLLASMAKNKPEYFKMLLTMLRNG